MTEAARYSPLHGAASDAARLPKCPFQQELTWERRNVVVEKAGNIPEEPDDGFCGNTWKTAQYLWGYAVNTYQAFAHLGGFEHPRRQLNAGLPGGNYREVISSDSLVRRTFLITDPVISKAVLRHERNGIGEDALFNGGLNVTIVKAIAGKHNLLTAPADEHAKLRAFMDPYFRFMAVRGYIEKFEAQIRQKAGEWPAGTQSVNITNEMHRFGLEALSKHFFGFSESVEEIQQAIDTIGQLGVKHALWPSWLSKPLEKLWWKEKEKLEAAGKAIENAVDSVCARAAEGDSFLKAMRDAVGENGDRLFTDEQIRDTVKLLFLAGQETSASLLTFLIYQLGRNPGWITKIRDQLATMRDRPFSERILNCQSLQWVVWEGLRLNPPAHVISRTACQNDVIRDVNTGEELFVPTGMTLNCDNYFSFRDERRWGENPDEFNPERHSAQQPDRGLGLAFGAGPDRCIGRHFATLEVKTVIAVLVELFDWTPETERVKQTGHFTCRIEADHQTTFVSKLLQMIFGGGQSSDIFINFKPEHEKSE